MSDNFKILGVGGAGVNIVKELGYTNSVYIDSSHFDSIDKVKEFLRKQAKGEKVVIVSSPAGEFSSSVLKSVCNVLASKEDRIFLIGIMPFLSESPERKKRGDLLFKDLLKEVESSAIVENENFASSMRDYSWNEMLSRINDHVSMLVRGFISNGTRETIGQPNELNTPRSQIGLVSGSGISLN